VHASVICGKKKYVCPKGISFFKPLDTFRKKEQVSYKTTENKEVWKKIYA